jgi:hypothetical protein
MGACMPNLVLVGLKRDVESAQQRLSTAGASCNLCFTPEHVHLVKGADEVVFVVSKSNRFATSLIGLLEAVERVNPTGTRWIWSLDGSEVAPVHRQLDGLPVWPDAP